MIAGPPAPAKQPLESSGRGDAQGLQRVRGGTAAAAGGEREAAGAPQRGPMPRPRPRPGSVPGRLARQGAAPAPPGSPRRGGTFPTGSDPGQSRGTGAPQPVCQGNPSGPDDARGSRAAQRPARAAASGAEPTGPGRPGGASRKRGPWAPLCEGRGRGAGPPVAAGASPSAAPTASLGGAARLPTPPLRARPPPHAPCLGRSSYRKGITVPSPPTRHLALSPPPLL
uniref:ras-related protein Rap-2c isoform X1 n=1 Tax=Panthera onca TaxID=9690 RepID=UPI002955AAC0|nr:ras-related protein Rap-2c isoform X1 [Panthera onca]